MRLSEQRLSEARLLLALFMWGHMLFSSSILADRSAKTRASWSHRP